MDIPEFLKGFAKPKPTAEIKKGDKVRHKETGIYSEVIGIHNGLIYGKTSNGMLNVGKIENFELI